MPNCVQRAHHAHSCTHTQRLNNYVDELAKNRQPKPTTLEFFVRDGTQLKRLQAQLTPSGSLAPLFFAFELISADDLANVGGVSSADDTNFLAWLKDQVSEAVRTAERHDVMKWHIRRLKSSFEEKYGLAAVQVGAASTRGCARDSCSSRSNWWSTSAVPSGAAAPKDQMLALKAIECKETH
eukprot:1142877-Pelagomonas_calceolata.AAC.8